MSWPYHMQVAVPDVVNCGSETAAVQKMYGLDNKTTETFGRQCLVARRLVEKGTRFVQIFHGSNGGAGAWDFTRRTSRPGIPHCAVRSIGQSPD